jgi:hypothetical protein
MYPDVADCDFLGAVKDGRDARQAESLGHKSGNLIHQPSGPE